MIPVLAAAAVYQRESCARTMLEDLESHLLHGLVYSTPKAFVMARYVCRDWPHAAITDPEINDLPGPKNCLHVYLAAGDVSKIWTFDHAETEWVSFERGNILRFYPYNLLKRRCSAT